MSLEWLVWLIAHDMVKAGRRIRLTPDALPPYLNDPGRMLRFALEGHRGDDGVEPDELAVYITEKATESYVSADEAYDWPE